MKRLTAIALALLVTTSARADDAGVAKGMMLASTYDKFCEKIPGLETTLRQLLAEIPATTMRKGMDEAVKFYNSMSTAEFRSTMKSVVADANATVR